jgi:hypothetical protein
VHVLLHCLDLLEQPAIPGAAVTAWALAVRLRWRRGKTALEP